jgi:hypothetical protein
LRLILKNGNTGAAGAGSLTLPRHEPLETQDLNLDPHVSHVSTVLVILEAIHPDSLGRRAIDALHARVESLRLGADLLAHATRQVGLRLVDLLGDYERGRSRFDVNALALSCGDRRIINREEYPPVLVDVA